uniref:Uncharacterized protein n=1 Tax=Arundo donax TaxID=35708 RepID=A0A0A8YX62_ARUDO
MGISFPPTHGRIRKVIDTLKTFP